MRPSSLRIVRCAHQASKGDERDPIARLDIQQGISKNECYFSATLSHMLDAIALDKYNAIE